MSEDFRGVLIVQSGTKQGEKFRLGPAGVILGRDKGDLLLPDDQISSSHCLIQLVNSEHVVFDMNSSNGTFVNGKKIVRQSLNHSDTILIGRTVLMYENLALAKALKVPSVAEKQYSKAGHFGEDSSDRTSVVQTMIARAMPEERAWKIVLDIVYENGESEHIPTYQDQLTLGRDCGFGKFSEDSGISRRHLSVKINQSGEVFAKDEGSTNGTFLNGEKMTGLHMIRPEDEVRIGTSNIKIKATLE